MPSHVNHLLESWVLGALLDARGPLLRSSPRELLAALGLSQDDFALGRHQVAFRALAALVERDRPSDARACWALCSRLEEYRAEGPDWLVALEVGNAVNRPALLAHGEELRRLAMLRRVEEFCRSTQAALAEPKASAAELAQRLSGMADSLARAAEGAETGDADVMELLEDWDAVAKGERQAYLETGVEVLDEAMGGFVANLNVIGGLPSVGKSALVGEIIMACLERGQRVGLFGLEDATKWLAKRHIARRSGISLGLVGTGRLHEYQQKAVQGAAEGLYGVLRNLLVYRRAGIAAADLVHRCRDWVLNRGCQAIFVDHGGEVQHDAKGRKDRFDLAVADTYRALRDLAVNTKTPIVVLTHFNRTTETERSGVPTMHSFAETEYIARMARVALGLWEKPGDARLRVTVLKRTEGERGITVGLERDAQAALIQRRGGEVIDLAAERQQEAEAKRQAKQERKGGFAWPGGA